MPEQVVDDFARMIGWLGVAIGAGGLALHGWRFWWDWRMAAAATAPVFEIQTETPLGMLVETRLSARNRLPKAIVVSTVEIREKGAEIWPNREPDGGGGLGGPVRPQQPEATFAFDLRVAPESVGRLRFTTAFETEQPARYTFVVLWRKAGSMKVRKVRIPHVGLPEPD
ncbi:MAG: hypothetical protein ACMVO3_22855 [Thalassobaculum sp.]